MGYLKCFRPPLIRFRIFPAPTNAVVSPSCLHHTDNLFFFLFLKRLDFEKTVFCKGIRM